MNAHERNLGIQELFDEAVRRRERLSPAERTVLFMKIFTEPPVFHFAPDADKIGLVSMRAYVYMRNSKGEYDKSTSMDRQFAPIRAVAMAKNFNVMGIFCDPDTSGRSLMDLPDLMRLVLLCRQGLVDVVIIEDADRLSRSGFLNLLYDLMEQHNIIIWDCFSNRQLTREIILLKSLLATTEVKKIGRRSKQGREISAESRDKITKGLGDGHKRLYPKGPVVINVERAPLIIEANTLFDQGDGPGKILRDFNRKWRAGNQNYRPPGNSKIWHPNHLVSYTPYKSGYLENRDYIGEFDHGVSRTGKDIATSTNLREYGASEVRVVTDKNLLIVPEEIFERNQRKHEERERIKIARKAAKAAKEAATVPPSTYALMGRGKGLLSGVVLCGACKTEKYSYETRPYGVGMRCVGSGIAACKQEYFLPVVEFTGRLIDVLERIMSVGDVLDLHTQEYLKEHGEWIAELKASKDKLNKKLERAKANLATTVAAKNEADEERDVYEEEEKRLVKLVRSLKRSLVAAEKANGDGPVSTQQIDRCRALFNRLRDANTYKSDDSDDIWIINTVREMLSIEVLPHTGYLGAFATVTLDFQQFFKEAMPRGVPKVRFQVTVPPKVDRYRRDRDQIDDSVFDRAAEFEISYGDYEAIRRMVDPHMKGRPQYGIGRREYWNEALLGIRSGAGPVAWCSKHTAVSKLNRAMRELKLWPSILKMLDTRGHVWIRNIEPALMTYLGESIPEALKNWSVTDPILICGDSPGPANASAK